MINWTLYRKEWKSNGILLIIFMAILSMYSCIIVSMFEPELGESLKMMEESMHDLFAAVGMADVGTTLLEFVTGYLYNFLFVVFPCVFIIILTNRLIAKYVDEGSMVYLLTASAKRRKIVCTQVFFLFSSLAVLTIYLVALIIIVSQIMFPGELEIIPFIRVNIGVFGVYVFFGGLGFLASCIFSETKQSLTMSSAVTIYAVLVQMISQVGEKVEKLKYITPLTLFDAEGLAASSAEAWIMCLVLYVFGILFAIAGIIKFERRDIFI